MDKKTFNEVTSELEDLYIRKNTDYGDSFNDSMDMFGMPSVAIRLYDKTKRIITLSSNDRLVNDESIRDTLIDMANYSIMAVMWLDEANRKKEERDISCESDYLIDEY